MRRLALLLFASAALASEPASSITTALVPDRFTAADFAPLTEARAARMAQVFPRLTAFLISRRVEIEAAQSRAARRSMPAARSAAIAALEAWLSQPPPAEALQQAAAYLTAPPHELLRDATLMLAAREELKLQEAAAEIKQEAASTHAELSRLANDPKLSAQEKAQLQAQLADLAKAEESLATTGQPVPQEALLLARRYAEQMDLWARWSWPR